MVNKQQMDEFKAEIMKMISELNNAQISKLNDLNDAQIMKLDEVKT